MVDNASGKMGTVVWTEARNGHTARVWRRVRNPSTAAQTVVRGYLARAARTFSGMTAEQAAAWKAYGQSITLHNPINGQSYHPSGIDIFVALTTKFLQVSPNGTIPMTPPTSDFTGDSITVAATVSGSNIVFTASGANTIGVTTEVLIQRLPALNVVPNPKGYRSAGFKVFVGGSLTQNVPVTAGHYAVAYRFVRVATGQATPLVVLPISTVALSLADGGASEEAPATPKKKAA